MLPSPILRPFSRVPKEKSPDELHIAVLTGRTKRIKNLLRKGVHIESVNSHGQTPLFCASFGGDNEVVALLLKLGANPNRRCGANGATPVHGAAYRGSRRVLRLLVEAGGNLSLTDNEDQTPRDYACKQPSPIRRQKILNFLDLLLAMTLHRSLAVASTPSTISRREGSLASVWASFEPPTNNTPAKYSAPSVTNLHKSVSCHMLDQMYVSTSLPLLSPEDLEKSDANTQAYTCGGPTVYSPCSWLHTSVTVRRPTPALSLPKKNVPKGQDKSSPDHEAVKSLLQELSILRRLRHPGFLEVMAVCHVPQPPPDHVTLVFQHVPYGSLYHHLHVQHRDLSLVGAVDVLIGVCEALLFLHAHGWLHNALSSHALHLVSLSHAKLGGFEYALETQTKGCSMQAPKLCHTPWLYPWQAPETINEQMVSIRSEIYSFAAIIWELWCGMPPWAGVDEKEIQNRVAGGETLPCLPTLPAPPPSLITYLTQYGLKASPHQRELDFQEVHTMLRSLKLQASEEERVPIVPAWGPPSVPNTPVIGRHNNSNNNNNEKNLENQSKASSYVPPSEVSSSSSRASSLQEEDAALRRFAKDPPSSAGKEKPVPNKRPGKKNGLSKDQFEVAKKLRHSYHEGQRPPPPPSASTIQSEGVAKGIGSTVGVTRVNSIASADSGFFTPVSRTPSPSQDTITSAKQTGPVFMTSTPARPSGVPCLQPDLLPSKLTPQALTSRQGPDVLPRSSNAGESGGGGAPLAVRVGRDKRNGRSGPVTAIPISPIVASAVVSNALQGTSAPPSKKNSEGSLANGQDAVVDGKGYCYISSPAKRAFFSDSSSEGHESPDRPSSSAAILSDMPSVSNTQERPSSASKASSSGARSSRKFGDDATQNGISDNGMKNSVVRRGLSMTNIFAPHLSNASSFFTRTTSHISLSSNSSSGSEGRKPKRTISQITLTMRKLSLTSDSSSSRDDLTDVASTKGGPQEDKNSRTRSSPKSPGRSARSDVRGWEESTAIKPASHQVTRHASSCSLASGSSSPSHNAKATGAVWVLPTPANTTASPSVTSPSRAASTTAPSAKSGDGSKSPAMTMSCSESAPSSRRSSLGSSTTTSSKTLEGVPAVSPRRRHSEGQRPRTRKTRRRHEVEFEEEFFDDEFNAMLYHQPHMQLSVGSSENLLDSRSHHTLLADGTVSPVSINLRSFSPSLASSEDENEDMKARTPRTSRVLTSIAEAATNGPAEEKEDVIENGNLTDADETSSGKWSIDDLKKEYEPLRSVQLLRNLEKNSLNVYLPTYSVGGSDTETGES
ncbi:uncharacterized protein LOC143027818 isoform X2 [Oratosquilla oratoria]|uniref:uncharacterized protein LOC143027818 isoform X2 n=1 Tax=Oratosquilla oratoria TaxID=337810 RepID=UPI003F760E9F